MSRNWKLHHVGLPVADLDQAADFFHSLGIGEVSDEFIFDSDSKEDHEVFGKPTRMNCRVRFVKIGGIPVELIQPLEGESVHKDFLEEHGDGINHIAFVVDDLDEERKILEEQGYPVVVSARHKGAEGGLAYFDTRERFGDLFLELLENPQNSAD